MSQVFVLEELSREVIRLADASVSNLQGVLAKRIKRNSGISTVIGDSRALALHILRAVDSLLKAK